MNKTKPVRTFTQNVPFFPYESLGVTKEASENVPGANYVSRGEEKTLREVRRGWFSSPRGGRFDLRRETRLKGSRESPAHRSTQ